MTFLSLDGNSLNVSDVLDVARGGMKVTLTPDAIKRMHASRKLVDRWIDESKAMYGITTGFGEFANVVIPRDEIEALQYNLIVSHAAGCGEPIPKEITRIMMVLRANALAKGYSGIRVSTVQLLLDMFAADIIPVVPSQGSVGSSGDLVQLAHLVLAMMGLGQCWTAGSDFELSATALERHALSPVRLQAKEGLALINGTQMMTAFTSYVTARARSLVKQCDIASTMTLEALLGTDRACHPLLHAARPHHGQQISSENILRLMAGSEIRESHLDDHGVVQDAYSLRCIPQVHGASRDAIAYVTRVVNTEINSATDNPLIFAESGELVEGGNFHGQPVALAADFLAIALSELANISERRTERMVNGKLSGLPRFLTTRGGLHSGMMIAQYTAASLVSENKVLAHPASVDSIPTSANQEDHNSMGSIGAQKALRILRNCENVIAIEFLVAAQALDFHSGLHAGAGTRIAHDVIRASVPHMDADRILHDDIQRVADLVRNDGIVAAVERTLGPLDAVDI